MGGPGGPKAHLLMILVSLWGALGGPFGDIFLYFLAGYFDVISNMFPDGLFDSSASLLGSSGHKF